MNDASILASKQWRIWTAVGVVFVCGMLVGIAITKAYDDHQQQQKWERGLAGLKPRVMKHLTRELHLTSEQQKTVDSIVSQAETELLTLRMAHQPAVNTTVRRTVEALRASLNPEQQSKLNELYVQLQRRWDSDRDYVRALKHEGP